MLRRLANGEIDATAVTRSASRGSAAARITSPAPVEAPMSATRGPDALATPTEGVDGLGRHLAHAHTRKLRRDRDEAGARERARNRPTAGSRRRVASPHWRTRRLDRRRLGRATSASTPAIRSRSHARTSPPNVDCEDGERTDHAPPPARSSSASQRYQSLWKSSPGSCSRFASRNAGSCGYAARSCRRVAQRW